MMPLHRYIYIKNIRPLFKSTIDQQLFYGQKCCLCIAPVAGYNTLFSTHKQHHNRFDLIYENRNGSNIKLLVGHSGNNIYLFDILYQGELTEYLACRMFVILLSPIYFPPYKQFNII